MLTISVSFIAGVVVGGLLTKSFFKYCLKKVDEKYGLSAHINKVDAEKNK